MEEAVFRQLLAAHPGKEEHVFSVVKVSVM